MYYVALFFVKLLSLMPFWLLYRFSDISFLIVYHLVGYRRKVVSENLRFSFPEKTESERNTIQKKFYRHFCDLLFEGFKLMSVRTKEMDKRMQYIGGETAMKHFKENRSVMILTSHYGNWEWLSTFSRYLPEENLVYQVYKHQKNEISDRVISILRTRFGAVNIEMKSLYRMLIKLKDAGKLGVFGMISDQSPNRNSIHYRTVFLNQDTPMIDGTEQIARKFNYPVYYCRMTKVKRGYYVCNFMPISIEPNLSGEHEITEKYARLLEKDIQQAPEYWLWSHKRWKYSNTRNANNQNSDREKQPE
ncbi:MAG: lysophospholipid acyltransferase family protein [Paludibacteraceae bacterium]